jgi:hypothetical protein
MVLVNTGMQATDYHGQQKVSDDVPGRKGGIGDFVIYKLPELTESALTASWKYQLKTTVLTEGLHTKSRSIVYLRPR